MLLPDSMLGSSPRIPNRFHFVFGLKKQTAPFHLVHYLCIKSCLEVNHPEAIYLYYEHEPYGEYWDLIRDHLIRIPIRTDAFIARYRYSDRTIRPYRYAHASDFVRLEQLLEHGGIYADMDTIFVNKFPAELFTHSFVLGREIDLLDKATGMMQPSLCNAVIMAERNAPFGRLWLDAMRARFDGTWSFHSTVLPFELSQQHPDLIHVEPSRSFYKHAWTREGLRRLLEGRDSDSAGVISMHLWAHLWWSRWRRDFSSFHGGRLTEDYIRNVDTTYNVIARTFLPPPITKKQFVIRQTPHRRAALDKGRAALRELGMKAYILIKLAAFSILNDPIFPNASVHLDYAKRQWAHPMVRTRFPARNQRERQWIIDSVILFDEYRLEARTFDPDDVILDVGGHVGTFSYMCHRRGSRQVYYYEPDRENFRLAAEALRGLGGIHFHHLAVVRSDIPARYELAHSGYVNRNTGSGNVLMRGRGWDTQRDWLQAGPLSSSQGVICVPLDEILQRFGRVRLLKLDCEGSEFPILLTSRLLGRVDEVIGEYHEIIPQIFSALDPKAQIDGYSEYSARDLVTCLEKFGFQVRLKSSDNHHLGSFRAIRIASSQDALR